MYSKIIATFSYIHSIFLINKAYAQNNYYIYCANSKKEWKWLKDSNKNYVSIEGIHKQSQYTIHKGLGRHQTWMIRYLEVTELNAAQKIMNLQEMCIKNYGNDFSFIQAAKNRHSSWIPLVINQKDLLKGYYELDVIRDEAIYEPNIMLRIVPVKETIVRESLSHIMDLNIQLYHDSINY